MSLISCLLPANPLAYHRLVTFQRKIFKLQAIDTRCPSPEPDLPADLLSPYNKDITNKHPTLRFHTKANPVVNTSQNILEVKTRDQQTVPESSPDHHFSVASSKVDLPHGFMEYHKSIVGQPITSNRFPPVFAWKPPHQFTILTEFKNP